MKFDLSLVPAELKTRRIWVAWRPLSGKKPVVGDAGYPLDDWNAPANLLSFDDACARAARFPDGGVGVVPADGVSGIDLDDCIDPATGKPFLLAETVFGAFYTETSPSGTGVKVFGLSAKAPIELKFDTHGTPKLTDAEPPYLTVTGQRIAGNGHLADITDTIAQAVAMFCGEQNTKDEHQHKPLLPDVVEEGTRNDTLYTEACRLRRLGHSAEEILDTLRSLNRHRHIGLDDGELSTIAHSAANHDPAKDLFPCTETGDAECFASLCGEHVRFDHRRARWLLFGGHHWHPQTDGQVNRLALETMRARQRAAVGDKDRMKWAIGGEARKRQSNLLALAQNVRPVADDGEGWDADPWLLGAANGVVDLRTGEIRAGQPEDRITLVSPVAYEPDAQSELWARFVLDVCDGDEALAAYLRKSFGYALTGDTREQCFWILYGTGSNGKSTLLEMFTRRILPEHTWSMNFPSHTWSESMSEYQRAELVGRRLVVAKENEQAKRLNTEFIKSLTGDETIAARHPYCRPFNFKPVAKFFLAVNHKPVIRDETHGMWRRVRLVPFLRTFPLNPAFAEALVAETPGVLAWAVRGAVEYYADGLQAPASVLAATRSYQEESNPLAQFFSDRCVLGEGIETRAQQLFEAYRSWCDLRHVPDLERMSQNEFGARVAADPRFRVETRGGRAPKRGTFYLGVGLLDSRREDEL